MRTVNRLEVCWPEKKNYAKRLGVENRSLARMFEEVENFTKIKNPLSSIYQLIIMCSNFIMHYVPSLHIS